MDNKQRLKYKYIDYQRFIGVLLILSMYLFLGAIINTYLRPSEDGIVLIGLTLVSLGAGFWLAYQQRQIKRKLDER
ncbi:MULTISPECIES: YrhC family protein [Virgibacillus]|uniref:YrhC family protein n=1 Tax=Virgibacillus dokdonensis TaxID=302167 RepID=A0A2K9J3D8_9BACI|nr:MULTISPECIES: YrhC family protein [Virgibacillus]AUJ26185.1 hypothetical protein A21D_03145 [Virgibacillus dokdonensis]NWO13733.1 hypothetical protein [Virgibacillus sp.]